MIKLTLTKKQFVVYALGLICLFFQQLAHGQNSTRYKLENDGVLIYPDPRFIGLIHSCCNMNVIMPQDKISIRNDTITWNFSRYQPDVVTICLGQNDGVQDSALFVSNYVSFLDQLRLHYPDAAFICLTSPMADGELKRYMKKTIKTTVGIQHKKRG
ncbi:hypothetical protein [Terrimonas pollutisoli]|uniref:hypothetical protein n=1 Tax=Terrimonas pollutisoli TaxID=3034147 RepID=UPI0023ED9948|nr:hypothetical protein [Terrimonas sp. H1YJ31]